MPPVKGRVIVKLDPEGRRESRRKSGACTASEGLLIRIIIHSLIVVVKASVISILCSLVPHIGAIYWQGSWARILHTLSSSLERPHACLLILAPTHAHTMSTSQLGSKAGSVPIPEQDQELLKTGNSRIPWHPRRGT